MKSIRNKIQVSTLLTLMVVVVAISGVTFFVIRENLKNQYIDQINDLVDVTQYIFDDLMQDAEAVIVSVEGELAADLVGKLAVSDQDMENTLKFAQTGVVDSTTLYVGTSTGDFYLWPKRYVPDDYDPRYRDWYLLANNQREGTVWTKPYLDIGTGKLVVSGAKFVSFGSKLEGVIGIDLLLSDVMTTITTVEIADQGTMAIVDLNNLVLYGKDTLKTGTFVPNDIAQLEDRNQFEDDLNFYFKRYPKTGDYYFVAIVPKASLEALSYQVLYYVIGIGLAIALVSMLFLSRVAKHITNPIIKLQKTMKLALKGDYFARCESTSKDEVGLLIRGFNDMIANIHEKNEEMTALYEELYASEETLKEQYDELYKSRELIKESEARYREIFDASTDGLWVFERSRRIKYLTLEWYENFDVNPQLATIDDWLKLVHEQDRHLIEGNIERHIDHQTDNYSVEYRVKNKFGDYRWVHAVGRAIYDEDGTWIRIVGAHVDITTRKSNEERIKDMAYKDALTGIGNRVSLQECLSHEIETGREGAIFFIDIDNFKFINDTYGHSMGDEVLIETANRLNGMIGDKYEIARISGDEFVIVFKGITDRKLLKREVEAILQTITQEIQSGERYVKITASIGVTLYPQDALDLTLLMRNADLAMYAAKERADIDYVFYDETLDSRMLERIQLENYLKSALDYSEIFVVYQPIISVVDESIDGFEALVRWQHPEIGFVSPDVFIPIAENTGIISKVGNFVLNEGLKTIKALNHKYNQRMHISINVSVVQLTQEAFFDSVKEALKVHDVSPQLLCLEITESIALEHDSAVMEKLNAIRAYGIGISLDDFGSGYSSINNLLNLPISTLKMDKNLVQNTKDQHESALMKAVVSYSHQTNVRVVSEGVETKAQLENVKALGSDLVQGYYYSKPVALDGLDDLIEKWGTE